MYVGLKFLGFLFPSMGLYLCFMPQHHFYCRIFAVNFEIKKYESSNFVEIFLTILGPLEFHLEFIMYFSLYKTGFLGLA